MIQIHKLARLLCLLGLLSLTSCWSPQWRWGIGIDELPKRTDILAKASDITVEDLFGRRMLNRPRKALVGNWSFVHEDETYVYLGLPRFAGLFDDRREIPEVFRTPKSELEARFPGWRTIDGEQMRQVLYQQIGSMPEKWQASLEDSYIRVIVTLAEDQPINAEFSGPNLELRFDKLSLTRIKA
ncbi:MAG: hypothetical protein CVV27_01305 [Candidatus Melainabacteria bacterium HGW-Melainabacteria-1]|nr:MAG: hypothetical protein CVV27_01305 [Candidatus Melainabacteria bacterium HGW-Melainabacteria-1]